jgi:Flp pilus assembly secretin CpaC
MAAENINAIFRFSMTGHGPDLTLKEQGLVTVLAEPTLTAVSGQTVLLMRR